MQKFTLKFGVFDSDRTRVGLDNQSQNPFLPAAQHLIAISRKKGGNHQAVISLAF
jgi:hypothetical protein